MGGGGAGVLEVLGYCLPNNFVNPGTVPAGV